MFYVDVRHEGLKKFRRVSGADKYVVEQRAQVQVEAWNELWKRRCEIDQKRVRQQRTWTTVESKKANAATLTAEAQELVASLSSVLSVGLKEAALFNWDALYNKGSFSEVAPPEPIVRKPPSEPARNDPSFDTVNDLWSWLLPSVKLKREETAHLRFELAHRDWKSASEEVARQNSADKTLRQVKLAERQSRANDFEKSKLEQNAKIDAFREKYRLKDADAVIAYIDIVLSHSEYPDLFPQEWEMDYIPETGVLIVDYELPSLDDFPTLKAVKYIQSRDALEQSVLRESEVGQMYDFAIYQTCLRTLHELFQTDEADALSSATFNGWVNFIDRTNGKSARACIMSVQATKQAFEQINLNAVDPKACFRSLKGVGSAKLAGMSAVVPSRPIKSEVRVGVVKAVAKSRAWLAELAADKALTMESLALREGRSKRSVYMLLSLNFLAPDIVQALIAGKLPRGVGITKLVNLPSNWHRQREVLGLGPAS